MPRLTFTLPRFAGAIASGQAIVMLAGVDIGLLK